MREQGCRPPKYAELWKGGSATSKQGGDQSMRTRNQGGDDPWSWNNDAK